ncbi:MAG: class I SAM-dependent methyltransferase [Gemmatimonadota bacterium]|nr:class I SAM-dependent methyltransferase [Gemmatimonadota bacterium]
MNKQQRSFYDAMYGDEAPEHGQRSLIKRLIQHISTDRIEAASALVPKGESLLDVGCGDGSLLWSLAGKFKYGLGVDITMRPPVWNKDDTQKNGDMPLHMVVANIDEGLPFKASSYQVVICIATLQHVFDPIHCLKEIAQVIRPGGYLVIQVPNIVYIKYRWKILFGSFPSISWRGGWDGGTLHYFTKSSLKELLADQGFRICRLSGSGVLSAFRSWWPGLLTGDLIVLAQKPSDNTS